MIDRARALDDCAHYWRATGVPPGAVAEMRQELDEHLRAVEADGRRVDAVIGDDVHGFAESWAVERRGSGGRHLQEEEVDNDARTQSADRMRLPLVLLGLGIVGLVLALALAPVDAGSTEDNEAWRWVWTVGAVVLSLAEVATVGFFLLPFGVGMAAAAVLAWLDVNLLSQWFAFFGVSALSFAVVQRFLKAQDLDPQPQVGANRWTGAIGVVLQTIDRHDNVGMVRVGGEEWRATVDGPPIGAGVTVRVVEVRGTRLVVEPHLEIDE
ncbi:MAG: NfeD family protein [Acidimicrobiia bacterium]|nr:NfeD family protein [Acidimicrobiia bacterium]MDH5238167.1 NfeD family protein [Acidimicrobiia bacterium]